MSQGRVDESAAVYCDQDMEQADVRSFLTGCVAVYSARCPGKQSANEDAAAIVPFDENSGALVVADGMGGHAAGEVAARQAVNEVIAAIGEAREATGLLRTGIIDGFERANRAVRALGSGAGTTLAVVEFTDGAARPYHAGDSVILIVGSRGKVKLETTSHSPVGYGVEAGLLDATEAMNHEDRHLVLNAVGSDAMRIEIGSAIKLAQRDTVLLASDGLTDNLSSDEIQNLVRKGDLSTSVGKLIKLCNDRMRGAAGPSKPDDLTVVTYRPRLPLSRSGG